MEGSKVQHVIGVAGLVVVGACVAIIVLGHAARKPEEAREPQKSKPTDLVGSDPTVRVPGEPTTSKQPAGPSKDEPLRQMHRHQLNETLTQLQELLDMTSEQRQPIEEAFRQEEAAWRRLLDAWLEQTRPQTPDEFATFFNPPYPQNVKAITDTTDARIKAILSETQWQAFMEWRPTYNKKRFFWHEED